MAAPWIVDDDLWDLVEPLIPVPTRNFRHPGRKRLPARECLQGILFVLHTGIEWADLPTELGFGSGSTCRRRMVEWTEAGVWQRLHEVLLAELHAANRIDWSRAAIDSPRQGTKRGAFTGPSPVDRRKTGSKHHVVVDGAGHPLTVAVSAANTHDTTTLTEMLDALPRIAGKPGRPRWRPEVMLADRGYDSAANRKTLRRRRILPLIARRGQPHGSGLGTLRRVVERTLSWLHQYRRLRTRWDHRADLHQGFLNLACALICYRRLHSF
ncbi:IS5/IS1182 family transposase [Actinosynnema pretiosum]|uniref:IS5/IS1182 family transposase n=1 Tax=Actinosynnema pretiosum TaxID=42197 RepID=A0A290Z3T2_9PSEU|nr:IS5/IS1182 family transposase [Actinosynnema pretiosum]